MKNTGGDMDYALVRFSDGIYHIASKKEVKNKVGTQASVYWKGHRSFYLAEILEESQNRESLINIKKSMKEVSSFFTYKKTYIENEYLFDSNFIITLCIDA
ncbi:hypothetical protein NQ314_010281 [Rhamnusium bicolor]|uniref:Uncharacterized protein n=1 Tax=Rhamnusium bicolor TaxID=1586634 RepID=A0AAV8XU36_9CUCU|nr:hypothetical protein NQ314_010281 [Rhamnusium bicolor]